MGTFTSLIREDHAAHEGGHVENNHEGVADPEGRHRTLGISAPSVVLFQQFEECVVNDGQEVDVKEQGFEQPEVDDFVEEAVHAVAYVENHLLSRLSTMLVIIMYLLLMEQ